MNIRTPSIIAKRHSSATFSVVAEYSDITWDSRSDRSVIVAAKKIRKNALPQEMDLIRSLRQNAYIDPADP